MKQTVGIKVNCFKTSLIWDKLTGLGFVRPKQVLDRAVDKTGQNLIETVNNCSGYETV